MQFKLLICLVLVFVLLGSVAGLGKKSRQENDKNKNVLKGCNFNEGNLKNLLDWLENNIDDLLEYLREVLGLTGGDDEKVPEMEVKALLNRGGDEVSVSIGASKRLLKIICDYMEENLGCSKQQIKDMIVNGIMARCLTFVSSIKTSSWVSSGGVPPVCTYPLASNITCDPMSKYRTINGGCNNLDQKLMGRADTPFARFLDADYNDMTGSLRNTSSTGYELPPVRKIVDIFMVPREQILSNVNVMLMHFGQFSDHDTDITGNCKRLNANGQVVAVTCGDDSCKTMDDGLRYACCHPIIVEPTDTVYSGSNIDCLTFVRSEQVPFMNPDGTCDYTKAPQQLNQITSWLDLSQVYGSNLELTSRLRVPASTNRGLLVSAPHPEDCYLKPLLPPAENAACSEITDTVKCFLAGDKRVDEHVGLTSLHALYLREHNRVERELHRINPHWNGDRLFEESRRIVIAQYVMVTFNEFLPILLGPATMEKYQLEIEKTGFSPLGSYNNTLMGSTDNQFATASFRYGHSNIAEFFQLGFDDYCEEKELWAFNRLIQKPTILYQKKYGVDAIMRGILCQPSEATDRFFAEEMSSLLFTLDPVTKKLGMSLPALNLKRGRDHGLPSWTAFRQKCGLFVPGSFDELQQADISSPAVIDLLKDLYGSVDDIDLFAGGLAENYLPGSALGSTFSCLIGQQFQRYRYADRFFFDSQDDANTKFTLEQVNELKKATLSRLICDNTDNIKKIQPWAFLIEAETTEKYQADSKTILEQTYVGLLRERYGINRRVACSCLPQLDLMVFMETPP